MAKHLIPSSFECDCGHWSHFFESTVREMEAGSRGRKRIHLLDSAAEEHAIEFSRGRAAAVICPKLGRREITGEARAGGHPRAVSPARGSSPRSGGPARRR